MYGNNVKSVSIRIGRQHRAPDFFSLTRDTLKLLNKYKHVHATCRLPCLRKLELYTKWDDVLTASNIFLSSSLTSLSIKVTVAAVHGCNDSNRPLKWRDWIRSFRTMLRTASEKSPRLAYLCIHGVGTLEDELVCQARRPIASMRCLKVLIAGALELEIEALKVLRDVVEREDEWDVDDLLDGSFEENVDVGILKWPEPNPSRFLLPTPSCPAMDHSVPTIQKMNQSRKSSSQSLTRAVQSGALRSVPDGVFRVFIMTNDKGFDYGGAPRRW